MFAGGARIRRVRSAGSSILSTVRGERVRGRCTGADRRGVGWLSSGTPGLVRLGRGRSLARYCLTRRWTSSPFQAWLLAAFCTGIVVVGASPCVHGRGILAKQGSGGGTMRVRSWSRSAGNGAEAAIPHGGCLVPKQAVLVCTGPVPGHGCIFNWRVCSDTRFGRPSGRMGRQACCSRASVGRGPKSRVRDAPLSRAQAYSSSLLAACGKCPAAAVLSLSGASGQWCPAASPRRASGVRRRGPS